MLAIVSVGENVPVLYNTSTGGVLQTLRGHNKPVTRVTFSPDCRRFASASLDRTVRIWDRTMGSCLHTLKGHTGCVKSVAFFGNDQLVSVSDDMSIRVWDLGTGKTTKIFKDDGADGREVYWTLVFSDDFQLLASATNDGNIQLWHVGQGYKGPIRRFKGRTGFLQRLRGHTDAVNCMTFTHDSSSLISAARDTRIWHLDSGYVQVIVEQTTMITWMALSPDDKILASTSLNNNSIELWDFQALQYRPAYLKII